MIRDGSLAGTLTRYDVPELAARLHVSRSPEGGGMFGSLAEAVEAFGLADDQGEDLARMARALWLDTDVDVPLPARPERSP